MGKKKHAEHVNHERWLVSYADLLTLLFAFFVVLFASSVSDKKKTTAMAAAMQSAFNDGGIFEAHAKTPPLEPGAGNSQGKPTPLMMPLPMATETIGEMEHAVTKAVAHEELHTSVRVHGSPDGTVISLSDAGVFPSGSAELSPAAMVLLRKLATTLPDGDLRVEGHTDNMPIHSERYRSNFELSTARAAAVAQALIEASRLVPSRFALAGYGEYRPMASNATAEGRAKNRRVDVVLLASHANATPQGAAHPGRSPMVPTASTLTLENPTQRETLAQQLATDTDRAAAH